MTLLCIHGITVILVVQFRREMAVLTADTAVLLRHITMGTSNGYYYSDCCVLTSQFYGDMD
jgi:hypothetical protein